MNSDQWTWLRTINTRRCQRWIVFLEPVCCIHLSSVNSAKLVKRFWRKSSCDKKESNYVQTRQRMMQINKQHGQGDARRESCTIIIDYTSFLGNKDQYLWLLSWQPIRHIGRHAAADFSALCWHRSLKETHEHFSVRTSAGAKKRQSFVLHREFWIHKKQNCSVSLWRIIYSPKAASRFTSRLFGQSHFSTGSNIFNESNIIKLGNSSYHTLDNAGLLRRIRSELARVLRGPCCSVL